MCGIAGFITPDLSGSDNTLRRMTDALSHRGPDSAGYWRDEAAGIALGHRRLSIIDVSSAGHQPMMSNSGRYVVVFNGEIYNHRDIRDRIDVTGTTSKWHGHSDTESLLAAIDAWGIHDSLKQLKGMFAFALWDRAERQLTLVRDRFGEKPLYYGVSGTTLFWASELRAIRAHPHFNGRIDRNALDSLVKQGFIGGERSIYEGVNSLPPGTVVTQRLGEGVSTPVAYWHPAQAWSQAVANPYLGPYERAVDEVENRLAQSVASQLESDVPLGCFLSGGIDSTAICALAQKSMTRPLQSYSIGFKESAYDEAHHAASVARHLGTDHTALYVDVNDARELVPDIMSVYDQPFADASSIPTTLLSRLTREHVTVALSGDGGDELFGGYNRYIFGGRLWRRFASVPRVLRLPLARMLLCVPPERWDRIIDLVCSVAGRRGLPARVGEKIHKAASGLQAKDFNAFYRSILRRTGSSPLLGLCSQAAEAAETDVSAGVTPSVEEQLMLADMTSYLPRDVLVKVDRASMSVGLETRAPMLDSDLAAFAMSLPLEYKISGGVGKRVLRDVAYRHVPKNLLDRPKAGFDAPVGSWLRSGLREWAESQLSPVRLRAEGFFDEAAVTRTFADHLTGRADNTEVLWSVLMFQSWLEKSATEPAVATN